MPATQLTAADGHRLSAFRVDPSGPVRGGLVVVQEIFGINRHIRAVASRFAALGYATIAPALFDRVEAGVELGYDEAGFAKGRALVGALPPEGILADLEAARLAVAPAGEVGLVGYCFGGAVVWVAAAKAEGFAGAVSYYGSRIQQFEDLTPRIPVLMHVGSRDASFPLPRVEEIVARHRTRVECHAYDAGHGFNCDHRVDFEPDAAALALTRTLDFLARSLGA